MASQNKSPAFSWSRRQNSLGRTGKGAAEPWREPFRGLNNPKWTLPHEMIPASQARILPPAHRHDCLSPLTIHPCSWHCRVVEFIDYIQDWLFRPVQCPLFASFSRRKERRVGTAFSTRCRFLKRLSSFVSMAVLGSQRVVQMTT